MKKRLFGATTSVFAAVCALSSSILTPMTAATTAVTTDLKADKLKSIFRREPRAQDLIPKVEARITQLKADPATSTYAARLEDELTRIEMSGPGETETRLKLDVDLLQAAAGSTKVPTADELAPLQVRYKKLAEDLSDSAHVKDFDRLLKKHDRFVRYTRLGIWDKDKIAGELQTMEEMLANAPDISLGKAETLRGFQNRRLNSVKNLVYLGTEPHEEIYLSSDRRSVGVIEEGLGGTIPIEAAELVIQNPDGTTVDLTTVNNPAFGIPFSPPLELWLKARMLEGRVPAITFKLPHRETVAQYAAANPGTTFDTSKLMGVQDVIDGKLDDYIKKNVGIIADTKGAAIVGLFDRFDNELAQNAFGPEGKTPFYMFDPKLSKLSAEEARAEYLKRAEKGTYSTAKVVWPDLMNHYGDAAVPDGPERVRDAWKRLRTSIGTIGPNLAYYSTAGAYHGSKAAGKSSALADSGTETWNKLEYYWPGVGVLDWIGIEAIGPDPADDPKAPSVADSVDSFFTEARSSNWQSTPVMLAGVAPGKEANPSGETNFIVTVFQKMVKGSYPTTSIVLVDTPNKLTLWNRDAASAYRSNVTSDKFYKWPLRFKMLEAPPAAK